MADGCCVGIDFGTDSVRVVVVDVATGTQRASAAADYPRWQTGAYCDPAANQFRQHPADYTEALETACQQAVAALPADLRDSIIGIGIDTTGSTVAPVDAGGTPLALSEPFTDNPNAMFVLWKDHTALRDADEINQLARSWGGEDFTRYEGGIYSSEWFWAKVLHVLRADAAVADAAFSWVEHCDWLPALLVGDTDPRRLRRSRCAAGHKAMWHESWDGLPAGAFLAQLDPRLEQLRGNLYRDTYTSDQPAGTLSKEWAQRLGLPAGAVVAVGAFDAHTGAVGGGVRVGAMAKILGTSTCDMIVSQPGALGGEPIPGICGQVDGSILPGLVGLEAGQSAYGDVYAWFRDLLSWPLRKLPAAQREALSGELLDDLADAAVELEVDPAGILSLDWFNGRRTPNADASLKGLISGLTLGSSAPMVFRSLVEATAFGSRAISEHLTASGIPIEEIIALGGISQRSNLAMQVATDVLAMPIKVADTAEGSALGSAMLAATAAGAHRSVATAQEHMAPGFKATYEPDRDHAAQYDEAYRRYLELGSAVEHGSWRR